MNGTSTVYIEQMYEAWRQSPASVHSSWNAYFQNVEKSEHTNSAVLYWIELIFLFFLFKPRFRLTTWTSIFCAS